MKKLLYGILTTTLVISLVGCGNKNLVFDSSEEIGVISREDGSGTRGAFIELFEIEQKDETGEKVDYTTPTAIVTNSTSVMMTTVANDMHAIGYISLGSLNDTVKAVIIDGAEASAENIKNGTYKVARPFNIATAGDISDAAKDFINFIMSDEGQKVVEETGYVGVSSGTYKSSATSGKVVVGGSSSVAPVMEKLKEAYAYANPNVTIEIQTSDSTTGISSTIEGITDIGMASRALKESELQSGLTATAIAMDGIVIIVNNNSDITELTSEQVNQIFTGKTTIWADVMQ